MSNRVVHFEIPCDDPQETMAFFANVFGWTFQQFVEGEYWLVSTGDENAAGINGGIMKKRDPKQPVVNSIDVENIDEAIKKIENSGGKVVVPKMEIPNVGWVAYFTDPAGNIHGVYERKT